MLNDFTYGFVYGFISAGVIGFILGKVRECRGKMGQRNKYLNTFPDAIQPKMTPTGIVRSSILSMFACLFWVLALVATVVVIISLFPFQQ